MADDLRAQYEALKADDPGRILIFRAGAAYVALADDAYVLFDVFGAEAVGLEYEFDGPPDGHRARVEPRYLAGLIRVLDRCHGARVAVLERHPGQPPERAEIERVVTPGRIEDA